MLLKTKSLKKELVIKNNSIISSKLSNLKTGTEINGPSFEFLISFKEKNSLFNKSLSFTNNDMEIVEVLDTSIIYTLTINDIRFDINLIYDEVENLDVIRKHLEIKCNKNVFIELINFDFLNTSKFNFKWTIPKQTKRVLIPAYITTLGQPYYVEDFFFGVEFPTADNRIENNFTQAIYYIGRYFNEIKTNDVYITEPFVVGVGNNNTFREMRSAFFKYIKAIARPARFRVQFNSWYDNMLDIDSKKIKDSFTAISEGFKKAQYRPLDCYVVDDGWIDYKHPLFWEFDKNKFNNEFYNESKLTKDLNSTFGVWFGPRGGYTSQTVKYANLLQKIGYHKCNQSFDICTGDPNYIHDLCSRMADFVKKYNVSYFKIDGFAITPCKSKNHGHPQGHGNGLYFYTFLWEQWIKGFKLIREANENVFLNITSYAHCSPWFLKWVDAVWINNCQDMGFSGKGSNLDQCLNYRDGKYKDFFDNRELQFPSAYIYNHEPTYAMRNCNPPIPKREDTIVKYTYDEFEKYMYMCMMRGTGFVELYFSPSMFDEKRYEIAAKVLTWAEENFDILQNSVFFGDKPETGGVYGYYAIKDDRAIMSLRNSSDKPVFYELNNKEHSYMDNDYEISEYFPNIQKETLVKGTDTIKIPLNPYDAKIFYIKMK